MLSVITACTSVSFVRVIDGKDALTVISTSSPLLISSSTFLLSTVVEVSVIVATLLPSKSRVILVTLDSPDAWKVIRTSKPLTSAGKALMSARSVPSSLATLENSKRLLKLIRQHL